VTETHVALCSGGRDSTAATHAAMQFGPCDTVVYLDTRTGLRENEDYVRELCQEFGWYLMVLPTPESYEARVREHGFPGAGKHSTMYRTLKGRQLCHLAARLEGDVHYWTGVRSAESDRRMRQVEPESERGNGRWTWRAPLHDWDTAELDRYFETFDLPQNPLWETLGRSADCFCGCFASREELLDLEAAGERDHARWIRSLEDEVADQHGKHGRWAWSSTRTRQTRWGPTMTACWTSGGTDERQRRGAGPWRRRR